MSGRIFITGIGPGNPAWMAPGALEALSRADVIVGYATYLKQIEGILPGIRREASGMRQEVSRAQRAVELAIEGGMVAVVSGGDPGIYGMAGLIFEILEQCPDGELVEVEVLPGITALTAASALLGAPLMTDFAAISLSDYLTPLETIQKRLEAAILGDFVICLYNPRSRQRTLPFEEAYRRLLLAYGEERPVGLVQAAYREDQQVFCGCLKDLPLWDIGMDSILIIGNAATRFIRDRMVTARGYQLNNLQTSTGGS